MPRSTIATSVSTLPSPSLQAGSVVGRYEIVAPVARGGMAEVFLARQGGFEAFEKLVVLKMMLPERRDDEASVHMFLDEARIAASFEHPSIPQVFDIGQFSGRYYFAMEYVEGVDMRTLLDRARSLDDVIPYEVGMAIVARVAAGLHYAHERRGTDGYLLGLVHRDVSPSNVLISFEGAVKVADFGIALRSDYADAHADVDQGRGMGKLGYMSPEQCAHQALDRRSDIFSLGILLYELTTGQDLFSARSEYELYEQIMTEEIMPPSHLIPGFPEKLEEILMKALARKPDDRYASAEEMQVAIEELACSERWSLSPLAVARYVQLLLGRSNAPATLWVPPYRATTQTLSSTGTPEFPDSITEGGAEAFGAGPGHGPGHDLDHPFFQTSTPAEAAQPVTPGGHRAHHGTRGMPVVADALRAQVWKPVPVAKPRRDWRRIGQVAMVSAALILIVSGWRVLDPTGASNRELTSAPLAPPPSSKAAPVLAMPPAEQIAPETVEALPPALAAPALALGADSEEGESAEVGMEETSPAAARAKSAAHALAGKLAADDGDANEASTDHDDEAASPIAGMRDAAAPSKVKAAGRRAGVARARAETVVFLPSTRSAEKIDGDGLAKVAPKQLAQVSKRSPAMRQARQRGIGVGEAEANPEGSARSRKPTFDLDAVLPPGL